MPRHSIISWNVNGIRAIAGKGGLDWCVARKPDVICLQETKAHPEQLDDGVRALPGYESHWAAAERKGYSGVAVYTKRTPERVEFLGDDAFDSEGRVLVVTFPAYTLINAYFPNSQAEGKRLDYKLAFCDAMLARCNTLRDAGQHLVLCGDYNIAHRPIDLANPKSNEKNPGYLPEERAWMDRFTEAGYVDGFRHFNDEPGHYTWWSYRFNARKRNIGWRIDYHCVDDAFTDALDAVTIHNDVMGSDHCPVTVQLGL